MLLSALDNELRPAFAKDVLGKYAVHMAAIVAMSDIEPGATLPRLFLAWRRNDFLNTGFAAIGTLGICHNEYSWI